MTKPQPCAACGRMATGHAFVNDDRYCHGNFDEHPTCYEMAVNPLRRRKYLIGEAGPELIFPPSWLDR